MRNAAPPREYGSQTSDSINGPWNWPQVHGSHWLRACVYGLAVLSVWSLIGRYWGIQHDAIGYMLEAMARLHPVPLSQDIFLRYRSQDEFTLFPRLSAVVVAQLGIDRAGALLTLVTLSTWIALAWKVCRRLEGRGLAALGVGLLIVLPGWYSAGQVFRYAEPFMTARGPAEVLSLAAILAAWQSHRLAAAALCVAGLLIHPLISFPAALLAFALGAGLDSTKQLTAYGLLLAVAASAGSYLLVPDPVMTGDWLSVTRWRSGFLFLSDWSPGDREVACQTVLTLGLAASALPAGDARRVLRAALCVALAGLALAALSSYLLPLRLLLEGQPWRWLWPARFFATAVLPLLMLSLWRHGSAGRCVAVLASAAWLLTDAGSMADLPPIGTGGLLLAIAVVVWAIRDSLSDASAAKLLRLSLGVGAAVILVFASVVMTAASNRFSFGHDPVWVQRATDVLYTPGICAALVVGAWAASFACRPVWPVVSVAAVAATLLLAAAPETLNRWTEPTFDDAHYMEFSSWRAKIPLQSEVLWPDAPQAAWFLLHRRSYLSVSQAAGTVFSQEATDEIVRRAQRLSALVAPGTWWQDPTTRQEEIRDLTPNILRSICQDPALDFVVSKLDVGGFVARAEWPGKADFVYLYDCRPLREGGIT